MPWHRDPKDVLRTFLNGADAHLRQPAVARFVAFSYARRASEDLLAAECVSGGWKTIFDPLVHVGMGRAGLFIGAPRQACDPYLCPISDAGEDLQEAIVVEVKVPWPGSSKGTNELLDVAKLGNARRGCFLALFFGFDRAPPWGGYLGGGPRKRKQRSTAIRWDFDRGRTKFLDVMQDTLDREPWWQGAGPFIFESDHSRGRAQLFAWLTNNWPSWPDASTTASEQGTPATS